VGSGDATGGQLLAQAAQAKCNTRRCTMQRAIIK
jgi:hypothetical protein